MTNSPASRYARFLALSVVIVLAVCAVGFLPTQRLAGRGGVPAMLAGCAVSLMSAALAGLLLVAIAGDTPHARLQRSVLAMVARLAVAVRPLALGAAHRAGLGRTVLVLVCQARAW